VTVVCGSVKNDSGRIDAPIGRHHSDRKRQAVHAVQNTLQGNKRARPAVTNYEVLTRYGGYTHMRCRLETGRTHQIRVHLAHIGYPVLGDMVYGRKKPELGMSGQCLHARMIRFLHPFTNEQIELSADLPEYFIQVLSKLEKKYAGT
jgi:23S rRNA pseudouridine1911/1915/1917 synthase